MQSTANLEFRKIPSLDFLYEISEDGRLIRNVKSKRYLTIKLDMHHSRSGYYTVWFCRNKRVFRRSVHSMVAECWLGACPEGMEIDHIDRDTHNNHYSNLRYVTHSGQMLNRKLGAHVIAQVVENCRKWNESISVGVILTKDGITHELPSMCAAARFIAGQCHVKPECARGLLKKRRSHVLGFDALYRNAETVRQRP